MDVVERNRGVRRNLTRLIAKESDAMQGDRLRVVLLVLQGRQSLEVADAVGREAAQVAKTHSAAVLAAVFPGAESCRAAVAAVP
jgi:hypothetical protein